MSLHSFSGAVRGGVVVVVLGALTLTGCGGTGATSATTVDPGAASASDDPGSTDPATSAGSVVQGTTVPADWPAGLDLPTGATLLYSTVDADGMSVLFDAPQDLQALETFFDTSVTALGYGPESDNGFVDMLSRSWTDGTSVIAVTATPVDGRTSGILMVRPAG